MKLYILTFILVTELWSSIFIGYHQQSRPSFEIGSRSDISHFLQFNTQSISDFQYHNYYQQARLNYLAHSFGNFQISLFGSLNHIVGKPEGLIDNLDLNTTINIDSLEFGNSDRYNSVTTPEFGFQLSNKPSDIYAFDRYFLSLELSFNKSIYTKGHFNFFRIKPSLFIPIGYYKYFQFESNISFTNPSNSSQYSLNHFASINIPSLEMKNSFQFGITYARIQNQNRLWNSNQTVFRASRDSEIGVKAVYFFSQF